MRKVLVVGASGLLGQYMMSTGRDMGLHMTGTYNDTVLADDKEMVRMDMTDRDSVARIFQERRPDLVMLCAAMTNVDRCEREPDKAYAVNMEGTLNVAMECRSADARMAYVSTDYVFNGLKKGRYHEFENPDPLGVYARSKLQGEQVTMDASEDNLVCRVSVIYGWNRSSGKDNFVTWIIRSLRKGEAIRLYRDQWVSPTYAPAAARDIMELAIKGARGLYHTSGPDCLSRHEIGLMVAEAFDLDPRTISPVDTADMPLMAARPARSCLSVEKAEAELHRPMVRMREGLEHMRRHMP